MPLFGEPDYDVSMERDAVSFLEQLQGFQKVIEEGKVRGAAGKVRGAAGKVESREWVARHGPCACDTAAADLPVGH